MAVLKQVLSRTMACVAARRMVTPAARGMCGTPAAKRPQQQSQHPNMSGIDLKSFLRSTLRLTSQLLLGTHTLCRPGAYVPAARFGGARSASGAAQRKAKEAEKKSVEDKLAEVDKSANKKDVPLGMLKADGSSKRFYKAAGVAQVEQDDARTGTLKTVWALTLDGRHVRTPANKLLTLPTKNMAMAIALEFDVQDLHILPYTMPMTTLATTSIDQISISHVRTTSIAGMIRQLNKDLITLRSNEPDDLVQSENQTWGAICSWASEHYGCPVLATDNWLHVEQERKFLEAVEADLQGRSDWSLAVLDNVSGATGSTLIAMALYHGMLDSAAANKAARLQEQYQVDRWGMVEASGMGGHDIDAADMRARLAAASVFLRLLPKHLY